MFHEIWRLLISGVIRLGFYAIQSFLAVLLAPCRKNIERLLIVRVLILVVGQVFHMSREVVAAIVRVNNLAFLIIGYSSVSRSRFRGQRSGQGHRKAAQKEENEGGAYFHYRV